VESVSDRNIRLCSSKQEPNVNLSWMDLSRFRRTVNRLVICGLMTPYCVQSTCLGALALGYPVTLAADGVSIDSKQVAKLIKEWNVKLQAAGAVVNPTAEIAFGSVG